MSYEKLDNEELLRIALDAINQDHHADAVAMLKTMIEREPDHVFGTYLLAAEHAQLGLMDRAEEGFERTVQLAPDFPMARFQLGQIFLVKGDGESAKRVLAPLSALPANQALSSYARGLVAAANEDVVGAMNELRAGLACEQEIPALADDMTPPFWRRPRRPASASARSTPWDSSLPKPITKARSPATRMTKPGASCALRTRPTARPRKCATTTSATTCSATLSASWMAKARSAPVALPC